MRIRHDRCRPSAVAPSRGRGSKRMHAASRSTPRTSSPPHGGADRNMQLHADARRRLSVAPSRGRGSKRLCRLQAADPSGRPLTGARIETTSRRGMQTSARSSPPHGGADRNRPMRTGVYGAATRRPLTGARIETVDVAPADAARTVAPSRGRGSKRVIRHDRRADRAGRPLTGARIETSVGARSHAYRRVAPSRGRGSKRSVARSSRRCAGVAPSRGRGSKHCHGAIAVQPTASPPHGGADRNTDPALTSRRTCDCRPLTGARIETPIIVVAATSIPVAPSRGRGSKPLAAAQLTGAQGAVAPSRGRGSKHMRAARLRRQRSGRPLTGARIETSTDCWRLQSMRASPPHGGADRNAAKAA